LVLLRGGTLQKNSGQGSPKSFGTRLVYFERPVRSLVMNPSNTPAQARQARGKPPGDDQARNREGRDRRSRDGKGKKRVSYDDDEDVDRPKTEDELFEERERRHAAARILESNELLIFHAHANDESIPQTRLRFEKIMIGIDPDASENEWEDDYDDDGSEGGGLGRGGEKGESSKKRAR